MSISIVAYVTSILASVEQFQLEPWHSCHHNNHIHILCSLSKRNESTMASRLDLDGNPIKPLTICMIGAGGFIGSHLCEKLLSETPHKVLALDVYNDKIKHLLEPETLPWNGRIYFHRLNIKNDSRLEGLIKMADLVIFHNSSIFSFFIFKLGFFNFFLLFLFFRL